VGVHRSAHAPIRLDAASTMAAHASQVDHGLPETRVMITATAYQPLWLDDPDDARALAGLLDRLALATPQQHRELAAQVRTAAAILGPEGDE
jgi:hypothetical protein